jgi:HSP20 family molecular chaperone IbpA
MTDLLDWMDTGIPFGFRTFGLTPYVHVEDWLEADGTYVLRAEMPGIDPDKDVDVSIDGDVLTIRGERQQEQRDRNRSEFHYGSFTRSLTLPRGTRPEDVTASYTDGVLEIRVPTASPGAEAVKVPVTRAGSEGQPAAGPDGGES